MKHLVIYAHPNPKSFSQAIQETIVEELRANHNDVNTRDLYQMGFNPILASSDFEQLHAGQVPSDIKAEQDLVKWADILTFIYPIWWGGMPAILKGYIDRVFAYNFAYKYENGVPLGLLNDKKVMVFNPTGSSDELYEQIGMHEAIEKTSDLGIFKFCNMEVLEHKFFGGVPSVDQTVRERYLKETKAIISKYTNVGV
ncbi:NAD(P)H-dependent oxidoreductase [Hazenella sp. IB182357]|uniref:NAD(P)H-dependent oxidoreductase n=1 Tax=Polycladospora coralii TaxID=2771432 RepID=A0A926RYK8_9BACL|nr:NAD(P)H-dependent oxidoreductase [Polycladospora coralii]MBD1373606.1 NAD(P)H-dependent oxidoreductase [Polycladospora coralii]